MNKQLAESLSFGAPVLVNTPTGVPDLYELPLINSGEHGVRVLLPGRTGVVQKRHSTEKMWINQVSLDELEFWSILQAKMRDAANDAARGLGIKKLEQSSIMGKGLDGKTSISSKFVRKQVQFIDADTGLPFIGSIPRVQGDLLISIKSCVIFQDSAFLQVYFLGGVGKVMSSDGKITFKGQELYPELVEPTKKILSNLAWDPFTDLAN